MSADPFANTTTVKNILQHVISPKIVKDIGGGYVTKTDLVNVHNLLFSEKATSTGTPITPLTAQCGTVIMPQSSNDLTLYHSRVTTSSVILAVSCNTNAEAFIRSVTPGNKQFTISLFIPVGYETIISWFIAAF